MLISMSCMLYQICNLLILVVADINIVIVIFVFVFIALFFNVVFIVTLVVIYISITLHPRLLFFIYLAFWLFNNQSRILVIY